MQGCWPAVQPGEVTSSGSGAEGQVESDSESRGQTEGPHVAVGVCWAPDDHDQLLSEAL